MKLERPLLGERIAIRNYTPSDLTFSTDMWFDPENGRYMSDPTAEYVDEVYQRALDGLQDSKDGYYLVVELRSSGERIGTCCAFPEEDGTYDIGYCIHKSRWKQGFGTEVVNLLVSWVRKQGGTAVTAEVARENRASCALLEKCGFTVTKESSFKKYHMNVTFDSLIYERRFSHAQESGNCGFAYGRRGLLPPSGMFSHRVAGETAGRSDFPDRRGPRP